jgi:hypothetical protein
MRVYMAAEIFEQVGSGHPGPTHFVARREAEREVKIARQVRDDGLPIHAPKFDGDKWVCWCEDESCLWNAALDSASKAGYLSAVSLLIDNLEYLDGDLDGPGITDTHLPPRAGEEAGDEAVPAVRGEGVPVAPPEDQEGER